MTTKNKLSRKGYNVGRRKPRPIVQITMFRANGEIGGGFTKSPTALQSKERARKAYFNKVVKGIPFLPDAPGAWFSTEILGQVNFPGAVPLETIIKMLNDVLNLRDSSGKLYDFRKVYPNWRYKYQKYRRKETDEYVIKEVYEKQRQTQTAGRLGKLIRSKTIEREITDKKTGKKTMQYA